MVRERIDVVIPVLHGVNGEDGSVQGLLQLAGIPYVGSHVAASAVAMDKTLTKLVADQTGVRQAAWHLVWSGDLENQRERVLDMVERKFQYPMFVKPAGTGSSVGVSKVRDREELSTALEVAAEYDGKILVEEFIRGREIEVAVMGNDSRSRLSAERSTPAQSSTIMKRSISPKPLRRIFRREFLRRQRKRSGTQRCGFIGPSAAVDWPEWIFS